MIHLTHSSTSDEMWHKQPFAQCAGVCIVIPSTDQEAALSLAQLLESRSGLPADQLAVVVVMDDAECGFIRIANRVFGVSRSAYFVYCAQDAFPGRYWLKLAIEAMLPKNAGLLGFNDGKWMGLLASFGMVRRDWASGNYPTGDLFLPEYQSHYADTELTLIAMQQEMYAYNGNAVLVEVDWGKDRKKTNPQDKALFASRKQGGFGGLVTSEKLLAQFS